MSKFRKIPIIVEAFKWTGDQEQIEDPEWIIEALKSGCAFFKFKRFFIKTLEGNMEVSQGDYIIRGVKGEIYPCKPDIFEMSYEKFDVNNHNVRKVITPDGVGEFEFLVFGEPDKVLIKIRLNGRKVADYKKYDVNELQEQK